MTRIQFIKNSLLAVGVILVTVVLTKLYGQNRSGLWILAGVLVFVVLLSLSQHLLRYVSYCFDRRISGLPIQRKALIKSLLSGFRILLTLAVGFLIANNFEGNEIGMVSLVAFFVYLTAREEYKKVNEKNEG